jgi:3-hydroxyisobutyrate dehydrogenase-like beta-hydroxyacid dehydrogenase
VTTRIGFVGLGRMGRPMAIRLVDAGLDPLVYDLAGEARAVLAGHGARVAASPREVGEDSDVVGVCVSADQHVRAVCDGPDGVFAGARPDTVVVVHSTVRPATIQALGKAAATRGLGFVDACLSGGEAGAADGSLVYMAGGEAVHVERCRPLLDATGQRVIHTGALGSGTRAKLCNNAMNYVTMHAAYEAWCLARKAGIDDGMLQDITCAAGVMSERMQRFFSGLRAPADVTRQPSVQAMLAHYLEIAEKDLEIALELAAELGVDLPVTRLCADGMATVYRTPARREGP